MFDSMPDDDLAGPLRFLARVVMSILLSGLFVALVAILTIGFKLSPLLALLLPGIVVGILISKIMPAPKPTGGAWFPGLGESIAYSLAADWLLYAAVLYFIYPHLFGRARSRGKHEGD